MIFPKLSKIGPKELIIAHIYSFIHMMLVTSQNASFNLSNVNKNHFYQLRKTNRNCKSDKIMTYMYKAGSSYSTDVLFLVTNTSLRRLFFMKIKLNKLKFASKWLIPLGEISP